MHKSVLHRKSPEIRVCCARPAVPKAVIRWIRAKRERRHLGISGPIRPYVARIARRHRNYTYRSLTITALSQDSKYNGWPEAHVEGRIRMAFEKRVYGRSTADSPAAAPERPYPVAHSERKRITLGSREASRYARENTCYRLGCWSVMVAS